MDEAPVEPAAPPAAINAPRPTRVIAATALALLTLDGRPARAEETAPPPEAPPEGAPLADAPEAIEIVVTGTRTPESSQRATVRTRVVSREEAERRGATNVGEALQGEIGVQVNPSAYGARGNPSGIQIQGFDGNRVLVLEDGERVIGDLDGVIDLSAIPLTDVSRVELVAGPTSSLYGTSAIGGVVNILSRPPDSPGASGRARIEGQSRYGVLLQGSGAYRADAGWVGADASFQAADSVSLDPSADATTLPSRAQRLLGLRAGTELGGIVDLRIRGRWIHDVEDGIEEDARPGLARAYVIDVPEVVDRYTLHVDETIHFDDGSNIRFSAGRQWALRTTRRQYRDSPQGEARERTGVLESFEGIATVADGEARTWVIGLRGEVEDLEQHLHKAEVSLSGVTERDTDEVPSTRLGNGAAYGQLEWNLTDALTVMPGVRGEMHLHHGGVVAPRLAAAYRVGEVATVRVSGGRGFRAPSAKEIGFSFDHSYLGYCVIGNPDLVPEASWGVNGDVTISPEERVTLRAGGFANWIQDLIDIDEAPVTPADPSACPGADAYIYRNIHEARTAGVELGATLRPLGWLHAEAGYAYLWTRNDTAERPLLGRPPHTVQAAIRADLPWSLELSVRYRAVTDAFLDEDLRAPGFSTVDARIARPLWPASQAYLGVKNLLDVHKDPARLGDQRPIEGRIVYLGIVAELPWEDDL